MVNTDDEIVLIVESIFKAAFPDWRGNNFHAIVNQVEFFCEKIKKGSFETQLQELRRNRWFHMYRNSNGPNWVDMGISIPDMTTLPESALITGRGRGLLPYLNQTGFEYSPNRTGN